MTEETPINRSDPASRTGSVSGDSGASKDNEIDLLAVGRTFLQSKWLILKFALVPAILTAIILLIIKPYYTAQASFLPPNSMSTGSTSALLGQLGALSVAGGALGGLKDPARIYVGILESRTVADDLIKQFDLTKVYKAKRRSQTEKLLKSKTNIVLGKDSIIDINVTDNDPKRAAAIANAYLAMLHSLNDRIAFTEAGQKRIFFEQQLEKEKNSLADAEVELARTQEESGLIQPGGQMRIQFEAIAQIQAQIASREVEVATMSQGATEQNPNVIRIRSEIEGLKAQLKRLESSSVKGGAGNVQIPTAKVPALTLTYIRKARDVKYHEALYELLLKQYEAAKLDESRSAPLMQVVDYAVVPDAKSGPARTLLTLLAAFLGGFTGMAWVFFRHRDKPTSAAGS
jgi:tyrosine-protein kinase Etk/Wzc